MANTNQVVQDVQTSALAPAQVSESILSRLQNEYNENTKIALFSTTPYRGTMDFLLNSAAACVFKVALMALGGYVHAGFCLYHVVSAIKADDTEKRKEHIWKAFYDFGMSGMYPLVILVMFLNWVYKTTVFMSQVLPFLYNNAPNLGLDEKLQPIFEKINAGITVINNFVEPYQNHKNVQWLSEKYQAFNQHFDNDYKDKASIIFSLYSPQKDENHKETVVNGDHPFSLQD